MSAEDIAIQFSKDYQAGESIRDQANEDMRFITIAGGMWEGFLEEAYSNKPRMEYDMIEQSVERFMGEWEANDLMPNFKGEEDDDDKDAELVGGLFRAKWRNNGGADAAKIAVFEVAAVGFGAIRLSTRYLDDESVEDTRQDLEFWPVHGAYSTVVFDSNAVKIDKSDAGHVSVLVPYTTEAFEKKWLEAPQVSAGIDDRSQFNWSSKDLVYVIEHYRKHEKETRVHVFMNADGNKVIADQKDLEITLEELSRIGGYRKVSTKKVVKRWVEKSIVSGHRYLEKPRRIAGKVLPVIPFYGHYNIVDGMEVYRGFVRKEKDPSRILNMQVSNLAEQAATSIKEVPIFSPEQVKGLEDRWSQAHLGNKNYQLARDIRDSTGNVVARGPLGYVKPPQIDPSTKGLIEFTTEHIRSSTSGMPLDIEDPKSSGKALLTAQKRVDMHTYSVMGNIVTGMKRIGTAFVSMAQEIYTDNRKVTVVGEDGKARRARLNEMTLVKDEETGVTRVTTINSLANKRFEVYADVGKSYQAQRRETIDFLKELVGFLPEGDPRTDAILSSIIDNMEGAGLDVIKQFNRKQMLISGLVEPEEGNKEEEALIASIQQAQNQEDPTQKLIDSQAALNLAEAEGKQAQNIERLASAEKKQAETAKIIEDIGLEKVKLLLESIANSQSLSPDTQNQPPSMEAF